MSKHPSYTSSVQGSELPAFNAAEIARDIRVNLKLREKQRLTGTSRFALLTFASSPIYPVAPFCPHAWLSESLNRVTAEVSATKESLTLAREKVLPPPSPSCPSSSCAT